MNAEFIDRHGQQGHGDALAGRQQNVHLAFGSVLGDLRGRVEQVVGSVAHCGYDDNDLVSCLVSFDDSAGDSFHRFNICDG